MPVTHSSEQEIVEDLPDGSNSEGNVDGPRTPHAPRPRRPARKTVTVVASVAVAALALSTVWVFSGISQPHVTIVAILPLSGASSYLAEIEDAMALTTEKLNRWGGINGMRIRLVVEDCASTSEVAVQKLREAEEKYHPLAVVTATRGAAVPMAEFAEENGIVLISVGASAEDLTEGKDWIFRYYVTPSGEAENALETLQDLDVDSLGILHLSDAYGTPIMNSLSEAFEASGGIAESYPFLPNCTEFSEAVASLTDNEAVFAVALRHQFPTIFEELNSSGYTGHVLCAVEASIPEMWDLPGAQGCYVSAPMMYMPSATIDNDFLHEFEDRYGRPLTHQGAIGSEALRLIWGLLSDNEVSRESLRDLLDSGFVYSGILGVVFLIPGSHNVRRANLQGRDRRGCAPIPVRSPLPDRLLSKIGVRIAAVSIVLLLMLASLALYSSVEGRIALAEGVGLASEAIAESLFDSLDKMIYMRGHEVFTIMQTSLVVDEANRSNTAYDAMDDPEGYIDEIDENWTSAPPDVITEDMKTILENNVSVLLASRLVEHYVSEHGMYIFGEILVTNRYGALVAATGHTTDFRQSDESWWHSAQQTNILITDIEYDESANLYGVWVCVPVRDASDNVIGVAKAVVNVISLVKDIELTALGYETSELKVTTSDGRLIFSSRAYAILRNVSSEAFFEHASDVRGHFSETEGGTSRLFSYATATGYLEYEGHDWIMFLSHAEAEVLGPATELQARILVTAALTIALGAVLSVSLSRSITRPVMELEAVTRGMARGELDKRIQVARRDELGRLANSFNHMASELESLYSDLDKRVRERTEELEDMNKKLGVLASITRHDAMNQMTVQKGLLYMAKESTNDPVVSDYLRKMEVTTDSLVSFFKFTSEYEEVGINKPEWINVREAFASASAGLDLAGRKLKVELDGVEVFADPMLPKVLHNLVANSLKHGQTITTISMSHFEGPNGLTIVMEDDGVGIPADRKEAILRRERVTSGRTHGLFLSVEILRITKISIRETGTEGKGVRFEILVPKGGYRFTGETGEATPSGRMG